MRRIGIRSKAPDVGWWPMVWYKKHVPRWSFILWLAILGRLSTKDRLHKWGIINDSFCVLCCGGVESPSHMFFDCPFSSSIWLRVRTCCDLQAHAWDLNFEVQWGSSYGKESSMRVTLFKLCLAASVYYLWKERNGRIFFQVSYDSTGVEKLILDEIVGSNSEEQQEMFGRHFDIEDELVSHIPRKSIDELRDNYRDDLSSEEWKLVKKLKILFKIDIQ
ncbi:hypothetical protein RHMOL_Rhmol02G0263700 [Rhododendron molle]|uniref:Uncharacterized protein n=2 Tax=Rhododendron molle TaxID=49168 RepID=A0ACC0PWU3_RHOML|nr:hypothetical protein RHMOL_Rhmol02G0263700 [Rhododendron molle]KAI8569248.1 hypothetical protein RHMOL_Rhmol02G0263700 [Rhododendron molle]